MITLPMKLIGKPKKGDYPEYAEMYMKLIPDDDNILEQLWNNFIIVKQLLTGLPETKLLFRYAKNKWSIKEILVHIIDDERIYAYRALRFARNEKMPLPGFDQDAYVTYSDANNRSLENIFEEYEAVRKATIALFNGLPESSLDRMGKGTATASDATPRALLYHIAGHELHHMSIIKEKYL